MILDALRKWKHSRKLEMYSSDPVVFFRKQNDAIRAMSGLEGYKMIKDFHFSQMEKAIENIKNAKPEENIEKHKAILEYSENLINFLESREK